MTEEGICDVELVDEYDYNTEPPTFKGYLGTITISLGEKSISIFYLTPEQIRQLSKELIEELEFQLEVFNEIRPKT